MKEITVKKWDEKIPITTEVKNNKTGEMEKTTKIEIVEANTLKMLTYLVDRRSEESLPKGLESFRTLHRISKAFDIAESSGKLVLDDSDYKFLKELIVKEVPSGWGRVNEITEAVDAFLNA